MSLNNLYNFLAAKKQTDKSTVIFAGHGNPMNAITENKFRDCWKSIGKNLIKPDAILCISAHWLTTGTFVTMNDKPRTIHDFYGFPKELFDQQYPAPGSMDSAKSVIENIKSVDVKADYEWGLDHGTWSVLMNMFPSADIPVFQLSLDFNKPPKFHFELGKQLSFLRNKGVLIIGSGNIVHNLRMVRWNENAETYDWAVEFDDFVKKSIEEDTPDKLIEYEKHSKSALLAHPTNDHYLPLLYILGLRDSGDDFYFFNDSFELGSMSMRSVVFG